MNHEGFVYEVRARVTFTREEVAQLLEWSQAHYDHWCRAAGKPGVNSFLWALHVKLDDKNEITETMSFRELDTLAKIAELNDICVVVKLKEILRALNEEYNRLNDT